MQYHLFDGGDGLAYPGNTTQSRFSGNYVPLPAEHHKRRTISLEKHLDTASREWRGNYGGLEGQGDRPLSIINEDEFSTHLVGAGWLLHQVAVHVKRAGMGTITARVLLDDGTEVPVLGADGAPFAVDLSEVGHHLGIVGDPGEDDDDEDGEGGGSTTAEVEPQTVTIPAQTITGDGNAVVSPAQDITGPGQSVPCAVPGSAASGQNSTVLASSGYLVWTYEGEVIDEDEGETSIMDGCFGVYLTLTDYVDEHECECAPVPCDTEFPDPECVVHRTPGNGG